MKVDITGAVSPCPICGKKPECIQEYKIDSYYGDRSRYIIRCVKCKIESNCDDVWSCLNSWNRLATFLIGK